MTDVEKQVLETLSGQEVSQSTGELDPALIEMGRDACEAIFGGCTVGDILYAYARYQQQQRKAIKLVWDAEQERRLVYNLNMRVYRLTARIEAEVVFLGEFETYEAALDSLAVHRRSKDWHDFRIDEYVDGVWQHRPTPPPSSDGS